MTGHSYLAVWPILDVDRTLSELKAEACAGLDAMAAADGARLDGEPLWLVCGDRLVCWAPARPWDIDFSWPVRRPVEPERPLATVVQINRRRSGGRPISPEKVTEIQRLALLDMADTEIAKALRVDRKTVARYREAA